MPRVKRYPVWLTDEAVYRGAQAAAKAAGESVTRWATARLEEVLTDGHPQVRRWSGSVDELLAAVAGPRRRGTRDQPPDGARVRPRGRPRAEHAGRVDGEADDRGRVAARDSGSAVLVAPADAPVVGAEAMAVTCRRCGHVEGAHWARGCFAGCGCATGRSEEHTSELQSQSNLVCRL